MNPELNLGGLEGPEREIPHAEEVAQREQDNIFQIELTLRDILSEMKMEITHDKFGSHTADVQKSVDEYVSGILEKCADQDPGVVKEVLRGISVDADKEWQNSMSNKMPSKTQDMLQKKSQLVKNVLAEYERRLAKPN